MKQIRALAAVHFDIECRACPRLAGFLDDVRQARPTYFCKPVPAFGDARAELVIVGLAPGMHGANRTGRPFTGDHAGILLYQTLHQFGFASHAGSSEPDDGMELINCRITNAVKCLPPQNKPEPAEIRRCNGFLAAELRMHAPKVILALGSIAHQAVLRALGLKLKDHVFGHHAVHDLPAVLSSASGPGVTVPALRLYDSYHCSRYNTQTRRLTPAMFRAVFSDIRDFLGRDT